MKRLYPFIVVLEALKMYLVMYERGHGWYLSHVAYSLDERPYVYRVLLPFLSRTLEKITNIDIDYCMGFLFVLSGVFFYFSAKYLYEAFSESGDLPAFFGFQALLLITLVETKVYDYATAAFFALSLGLLARGKHGVFLLVFPFATLNRETTFLLTLFYAVYFFGKLPLQKYLASLSVQTSVYLSIKFITASVFSENGGQGVYFGFPETVSIYTEYWPALLVLVPFVYLVIRSWKQVPVFMRIAVFVLLPVQVILHLLFGKAFEVRVFAESMFLVSLLIYT
jgi:hypothetical protein